MTLFCGCCISGMAFVTLISQILCQPCCIFIMSLMNIFLLPRESSRFQSSGFVPCGDKQILKQNSVNLTSYDSEILIIWQLEESSSKTASFAFYQRKASPIKQAHLNDKFKKSSQSICTSTVVLSDPLSPIPSTQKRALMTLNQQMKEISRWNTRLISFQPQYRSQNKSTTCKNLGQYRYYLIIQNIWQPGICLVQCESN